MRDATQQDRRHSAWLLVWIALGLFLVLRTGGRDRGVITDHLEFGRRLISGAELYQPYQDEGKPLHPFYPPSFGLLCAPYSLMPERVARYAWGLTQVLALWSIGAFLAWWLRRDRPALVPKLNWLLLATALLAGRYVLRDTHGGGGNLINLALVLGAYRLAEDRRTMTAALLLGLSLATKPNMVLLVPMFWLMGYRRLPLASLGYAAMFSAAALWIHGQGSAPLAEWLLRATAFSSQADVYATSAEVGWPFLWMNQSLSCALSRYLGEVPPEIAAEVPGFVQGLGLGHGAVHVIGRVVALTLLLVTMAFVWLRALSSANRYVGLCATLAVSLLLSPIAWKTHLVALIPAFFLLFCVAFRGSRAAWILAIAYFLCCSAGGGDLVGSAGKAWQQSLYLATFGTIAVWIWLIRRPAEPIPPPAIPDSDPVR